MPSAAGWIPRQHDPAFCGRALSEQHHAHRVHLPVGAARLIDPAAALHKPHRCPHGAYVGQRIDGEEHQVGARTN